MCAAKAAIGLPNHRPLLLALSDYGRPAYDQAHAQAFAALGCPVFACTPDQFPDLMAAAPSRQDTAAKDSRAGIHLVWRA